MAVANKQFVDSDLNDFGIVWHLAKARFLRYFVEHPSLIPAMSDALISGLL